MAGVGELNRQQPLSPFRAGSSSNHQEAVSDDLQNKMMRELSNFCMIFLASENTKRSKKGSFDKTEASISCFSFCVLSLWVHFKSISTEWPGERVFLRDSFLLGVSFGSSHNAWLMREEDSKEGTAQGSFEILFVLTDIFSFGLCQPVFTRWENRPGDGPSGSFPRPAYKRKTQPRSQLLGGEAAQGRPRERGDRPVPVWPGGRCHSRVKNKV